MNRTIGIDSSLYYMNEMLSTDNVSYKTFAYAAIEYLKTREKQAVDIQFYKDSINKYLPKVLKTKKNYTILFDIHILLGNTNKRRGLIKPALENYIKAENYARSANDIERIIKIKGNVALIYQNMEELSKALNEAKNTLKLIENNKDALADKYQLRKYKTRLNLGAIYTTLYRDSITNNEYADSALFHYNSLLKNKYYKLSSYRYARINYNLGTIYTLKKEYSKANHFLEKSIKLFKKNNSFSFLYKSHFNNGYNYYMANNLEKAKKSFFSVFQIKKDTLLDSKYVNTHKYLFQIYLKQKNNDSASYYSNRYHKLLNLASIKENKQIIGAVKLDAENNYNKKIDTLTKSIIKKNYYYTAIIIGLILILLVSIYLIVKNIKEKKEAKKRLSELLLKVSKKEKVKDKNFSSSKNLNIKDEQHQQIINGLLKIEEKLYFLKEEFNLYNAAKKIGTNTTYLSKVIREYKKMSFSEYTNELRINYIVNTMSNDKKVRAYTTQAIGEIGGYKNAKSFTRIFKNYTGITPYQFIEKIDKES
ncbi:helix-turn-helix domain-containing protein [Tenacibaculum sp. S7007]|uniref:Helix-turn-helix domain-containing protein n=1 Tax=Tenacibaculum pelagium TaxID=2759527 RepID=A0A839ALB1_9FLAO|nr:helix-turn-helix domain-containing protein [Tenacibaculum pelagium]MBA6154949.1 helix-turn-helix domain-containing protein [Tenacibaculum pelagium]